MAIIEVAKIQVRRGQELQTGIPRLDPGEFGWAEDTENLYIGKRIAEGAADDNNSRILTNNDLDNIFSLIGSSVTNAISYKYREDVSYISHAVSRKIQSRLDDEVSLASFGVKPSFTATDITLEFQNAINDLFYNQAWNSFERSDARRALIIPAGNYLINGAISLPPYTTLIGQGQDITILTLTSSNTNMFETMDAMGNSISKINNTSNAAANISNMQSGIKRARDVTIQGMTLQYSSSTIAVNTNSLISLDNVLNANIKSVSFKTDYNRASTTTYGLVTGSSKGISIHGTGGSVNGSMATNLCVDISIDECQFDSLVTGVVATGVVVRPVITNSMLNNLGRGIVMQADGVGVAPTNGVFRSNRVENVVAEGIYASTSTNMTNHISENNYFVNVANGPGLDDFVTSSTGATSVIKFFSNGNTSINDYFNRKTIADNTTNPNFYYNPLIAGRVAVNNNTAVTTQTAVVTTASVMKIGLNGQDQMLSIRYQLTNSGVSRKGNLILNIARDGYSSITDTYNYIIDTATVSPNTTDMAANISLSGSDSLVVSGPNAVLNALVGSPDGYYITGNDVYRNLSGYVNKIEAVSNGYKITTNSASPQFDYTTPSELYTLVQAGSNNSYFVTDESQVFDKNYVKLAVQGNTTVTNIEYQIDILT